MRELLWGRREASLPLIAIPHVEDKFKILFSFLLSYFIDILKDAVNILTNLKPNIYTFQKSPVFNRLALGKCL